MLPCLIILCLINLNCFASPNPWLDDPLAKVNLFDEKNLKIPPNNNECLAPATCPLCDIAEEWPLDFNGDDLAEKAQRRTCALKETRLVAEEVIIIYSSDGQPLIYKSNSMNCQKNRIINYSHFERFDFNRDNLDELILVEHDQSSNSDEVKILGFNQNKGLIEEMVLIEYETDLQDQYSGDLQNIKKQFLKINGKNGFVIGLKADNNQEFQVHYYQDLTDKAFYPLSLIEVNKKTKPIFQAQKSQIIQNTNIEFIE